jgi:hypothetical protein
MPEDDFGEQMAARHDERWGGWRREPFTSDSTNHVSVWEKTASWRGSALLQRQPGPEPDEHDPATRTAAAG